jgi:hypothetical protein
MSENLRRSARALPAGVQSPSIVAASIQADQKSAKTHRRHPGVEGKPSALWERGMKLAKRKRLMERARQGDQRAIDQLWETYKCRLL